MTKTDTPTQSPAPAPIIHLRTVDSTNAYCQRRAQELPCPCVVLADEQTAGRGRQGRSWHSPDGENLYLSILLPLPQADSHLPALPMAAALAGLDALTAVGVTGAWIKWPNDLLIENRKIMGVLIETCRGRGSRELAVVGIGMNLDMSAADLAAIDRPATSVRAEAGRDVERAELLQALIAAFFAAWEQAQTGGAAALQPRWSAASRLLGRSVQVELPNETLSGTVTAFATDGSLCLRLRDGSDRRVQAGDVHLRPL